MKLFISWSGGLSKEIGEVFRKWVPSVIQVVKPYFTPDDIEKGARWNTEIAGELAESEVGIIILTRENLESLWIMFEGGALSKQLDKSRICPILFGIETTDLVGPLVQFQATNFNEKEINQLMKTINNACGEYKLENGLLDNVFKRWWPELKGDIEKIIEKLRDEKDEIIRGDREILEEILSLSRMAVSTRRTVEVGSTRISPAAIRDLDRRYRKLRNAFANKSFEEVESMLDEIGGPIGYIVRRGGVGSPGRLNERRISETKLESEEEEEEEEV